jgi:hypothetical protein
LFAPKIIFLAPIFIFDINDQFVKPCCTLGNKMESKLKIDEKPYFFKVSKYTYMLPYKSYGDLKVF